MANQRYKWAVVGPDGSVQDRFVGRDEAESQLYEYPAGSRVEAVDDHEWVFDLAARVEELLREWAASDLVTGRRHNGSGQAPGYARSFVECHDFCDANMAIIDAFEEAGKDWHDIPLCNLVCLVVDESLRERPIRLRWKVTPLDSPPEEEE